MSARNARTNDENRPNEADRYAAVRDPGATPRRSLKNDNVAVVHSSEIDSEPNTELYEAYEEDEENDSAAPRKGDHEETHKTIP
jgi:hypothetical protein